MAESPMMAKEYTAPSARIRPRGCPSSQPNVKEQAALEASSARLTPVRPQRSERAPDRLLERRPTRCIPAVRLAPTATATPGPAPEAAAHAARKAGVHPHMPSSSQAWNVYAQLISMPARLRRVSRTPLHPGVVARGGSATPRITAADSPAAATGPKAASIRAPRQPTEATR